MCGLAAIYAYRGDGQVVDQQELLRMRESMLARGPDGAGLWVNERGDIGLAHRRLSIIDISESGKQPMHSTDGRYSIVFNGEIYNYRQLQADLQAKGSVFRSHSDTEVLLELYRRHGKDMLSRLRGMFAFAIWDHAERRLFLARDPFGIKPLYMNDQQGVLRISSQVKAMLAGGKINQQPSPAGQVGFLLWGSVPEPFTLFEGIRALPAGCYLYVDSVHGVGEPVVYQKISDFFLADPIQLTPQQRAERVRVALEDTLEQHMVADVPVGLFLSAGKDSATLAALASQGRDEKPHTITLGFREFINTPTDETPLAEQTAQRYGTQHQTRWISRSEFDVAFEHLLMVMDQPSIDGINTYFVSRAAHQAGMKVALSGVGADELFGGYPSFKQIPESAAIIGRLPFVKMIGKGFRLCTAQWINRFTSPKYAGMLEYGGSIEGAYLLRRGLFMPWELPKYLDSDMVRQGWNDLQTLEHMHRETHGIPSNRHAISVLEFSHYMRNQLLRDTDWAGMAHSLEIRVPFVDIELIKRLAPILANAPLGKVDMVNAPQMPLSLDVAQKPKTGFAIPTQTWLDQRVNRWSSEGGLRPWALYLLEKQSGI